MKEDEKKLERLGGEGLSSNDSRCETRNTEAKATIEGIQIDIVD